MSVQNLEWPRQTAHLVIRPVGAADAEPLWQWHRLPEVTFFMPRLSADPQRFAQHLADHAGDLLVATLADRQVALVKVAVGDSWAQEEVAADAVGTVAEIGWALDPSVQGRGLGTEVAAELLAICFDGLGLRRVVAQCTADNTASWRIMEKVGMRREAHWVADALHRDGRWYDSLSYAILADEWRAQQA